MGLFDFGKTKEAAKTPDSRAKLDKDIEGVLKDLRKNHVDKCQNIGLGVTKMGSDLSYIEKRTREYYGAVVQEIKSGKTAAQTYQALLDEANTPIDRDILARMFSLK